MKIHIEERYSYIYQNRTINLNEWELISQKGIYHVYSSKRDKNITREVEILKPYLPGEKQTIIGDQYFYKDTRHREDGPAIIKRYEHKPHNLRMERYYINGEIYREDGPAEIYYFENGKVKEVIYSKDKGLHREDGPTIIDYYKNGSVRNEEYFLNNMKHREDGPAVIGYYEDGTIGFERYYSNDQLHREDGPAVISYDEDGIVVHQVWYENGQIIKVQEGQ